MRIPPNIRFVSVVFFVGYLLLCLLLNEFHPFSKYSMYSSFPNYSYVFYVKDGQGNLLPFNRYFRTDADRWAHLYFALTERNGFAAGNGVETDEQLRAVGTEMLKSLLATAKEPLPFDSVVAYRMNRYFMNDSIVCDEKRLCAIEVE